VVYRLKEGKRRKGLIQYIVYDEDGKVVIMSTNKQICLYVVERSANGKKDVPKGH
jgi:hypothetical protein